MSALWPFYGKECPRGPHRGPQGPNEDISQCGLCGSGSYSLRPEGETFGDHIDDCSLPLRHEGYCVPGGNGHPKSRHQRGFFPAAPASSPQEGQQ